MKAKGEATLALVNAVGHQRIARCSTDAFAHTFRGSERQPELGFVGGG